MKGPHQTNFRGYRKTGNVSTKRAVVKVLSTRVSENTHGNRPGGKEPTTVHLPGPDGPTPDDPLALPYGTVFFYPVSCSSATPFGDIEVIGPSCSFHQCRLSAIGEGESLMKLESELLQ